MIVLTEEFEPMLYGICKNRFEGIMLNPKGCVVEYEKNGRVRLVIVVAASKEQAREKLRAAKKILMP